MPDTLHATPAVVVPPGAEQDPEHFLERIATVAPAILYVFDLETMENVWVNRSLFAYLGHSEADIRAMGDGIMSDLMHPDDYARFPAHIDVLKALNTDGTAKFEYRMRTKDGRWVWLHSHEAPYQRAEDGTVRRIVGSAHDITAIKEASERVELVSSELLHRVRNIFTVVGAMVSMAGRSAPEARAAFDDLRGRIGALSQAHDVALQTIDTSRISAGDIIERTLAPYRQTSPIKVRAEGVDVLTQTAASLGLVLHELATNAVKYGGLRNGDGGLDLSVTRDGDAFEIDWRERIAPPLDASVFAASKDGFGTKMIRQAVRQLGGTFERHLEADGLHVTIRFGETAAALGAAIRSSTRCDRLNP
ncbi:sensor histidine kinase [Jannaschia aquimarina]|uniref:histidine kinase n=1 Tax=Jannaschia aquimarina TaxID=935700 RepID=A0A0D1CQK1_9RHOB|nr:HWE histidine kinase domain-containing protein [Jannaschia aquimarina]KIT17062.1 Blue-light-activated histidine kinase 1 [Jannaschia aquimarina]SNS82571.1 PAS domain S-box-containing protein [Jannaschia aquimarina]